MADKREARTWNITDGHWEALRARAAANADALEDGAYVRVVADEETGLPELHFYATPLNKPGDWRYPFADSIPDSSHTGAFIGRVWHAQETGFVHFEVIVYAAAQAVTADYESGVSDLDYVTYEQAVDQALRGTPTEEDWLAQEFARLVSVAG